MKEVAEAPTTWETKSQKYHQKLGVQQSYCDDDQGASRWHVGTWLGIGVKEQKVSEWSGNFMGNSWATLESAMWLALEVPISTRAATVGWYCKDADRSYRQKDSPFSSLTFQSHTIAFQTVREFQKWSLQIPILISQRIL